MLQTGIYGTKLHLTQKTLCQEYCQTNEVSGALVWGPGAQTLVGEKLSHAIQVVTVIKLSSRLYIYDVVWARECSPLRIKTNRFNNSFRYLSSLLDVFHIYIYIYIHFYSHFIVYRLDDGEQYNDNFNYSQKIKFIRHRIRHREQYGEFTLW